MYIIYIYIYIHLWTSPPPYLGAGVVRRLTQSPRATPTARRARATHRIYRGNSRDLVSRTISALGGSQI